MTDSTNQPKVTSNNIPHWYKPDNEVSTIVTGNGARVYDDEGTEYLDFISQLYCVNAGHGNAAITERITQQLEEIQYVSPSKHNDARTELAERIADVAPENLTDVMFSVSGSEANEIAIQTARAYQNAPKILTRWQSYHGSTYGAGALTGDPSTRSTIERHAATTGYAKFLPPLTTNGAFDAETEEELAQKAGDHLEFVIQNEGPDSIAAIMMEPIGGTSGAYPAPTGYFERVRQICDEYDILLIADEVISGFGRCGDWFGIQTENVQPDMVTFAKGCTSAYVPLAGVIIPPDIADHCRSEGVKTGQTFSGHPVACAAGLGAMDAYEDGLLDTVIELAPYFEGRLSELASKHDVVGDVRGRGFLWAVTFADPDTGDPFIDPRVDPNKHNPVDDVLDAAKEQGVLLGSGRPNTQAVLSPPFSVGEEEIDIAIDVLDEAISNAFE